MLCPFNFCSGSVLVFVFGMHYFCFLSSFAIFLVRKRELVALLLLSFECLVTVDVLWLYLVVLWLWHFLLIITYIFTYGIWVITNL